MTLRNPARERLERGELSLGLGIRLAKSVDIALLKAQMALSKDNQKGILGACSGALEQIGSTPEDLKGDLDEFKEFAQLLKQTLGAGATEQNAMITQLLRAA